MKYLENCVDENLPLTEVLEIIERTHKQSVVVVQNGVLKGTVTDGDIRRYLLTDNDLNAAIKKVMCRQPIYLLECERASAIACMKKNRIHMVPIVDGQMKVVDIEFDLEHNMLPENVQKKLKNVPVVIMAGGEGRRLLPYTSILPKPLMPIGECTALEHIINSFSRFGCEQYFLTLNYKKEIIKAYLKEACIPGHVDYVVEKDYMGTAGSLALLKDKLQSTFIVSNCDILLDINYNELVEKHRREKNKITLVVLQKNYEIPYGVVNTDSEGKVLLLQEKPLLKYQLNTGVYVVEPDVIGKLTGQYIHMTELIESMLRSSERVGSYVISENQWTDIGEMENLNRVNRR